MTKAEMYKSLLERLDAGANHRDYPEAFGGSWTNLCSDAATAIRRLAAQADVPDGWKLVPIHGAEEKMAKQEMLALADFLAEQNAYHSNSMACHDPIIQAHVQRLSAWEKAVRLAVQADAPGGLPRRSQEAREKEITRLATIEECAMVAESYPSSGEQTEHPVEYWIRRLSHSRPDRESQS